MQKEIYQEKDPEERVRFLRDTCDKMENFSYEKAYTNQDVAEFADRVSAVMIEVRQMEVELSKVKKEFAEKMKPLKSELSELLNNIKFRSKMIEEPVYIFIDHEKNQVGYYTSEGILVHKRMLRIDEHQRSIMGASRRNMQDEDEEEEEIEDNSDIIDIESEEVKEEVQ